MKKTIFSMFVLSAAFLSLTACGSKGNENAGDTDTIIVDQTLAVVNDSVITPGDSSVADTVATADEEEEATPALPAGVVGEVTVPGIGKITFKKGGNYTAGKGESGSWKKKGKVVEFYPVESTMVFFILDGKVYEGTYNAAANTRTFEYQTEEGDLDEKTVKVTPKDGNPVKDFVWAD